MNKPRILIPLLASLFLFIGSAYGKEPIIERQYWDNKSLKGEIPRVDGKVHGTWTIWHKNGKKEQTGNYIDGKQEGLFMGWYEDGKKTFQGNFVDGNEE